jgi:ribosome biogenesis GTPase / thiamine phosphate phosphatase
MTIRIETIGWDAGRAEEWTREARDGRAPGRIAVQHRGAYDVLTAEGEVRAEVVPRLVRGAASRSELPVVGDWVEIEPLGPGRAAIHALLERRTKFSRLAAHDAASGVTEEQVVAANIDIAFVVSSVNEDLNVRRIERYLTLARQSGARPVVLLTKTDLVSDPAAAVATVSQVTLDVPVHPLSTSAGVGLEAVLGELGPGLTAALLGSSGVGKSTLVNALVGNDRIKTAAIRSDGKGRHTTTRRELIVLPGGAGLLIDTPGMRELQLWSADQGLEETFDDVTSLFGSCRFADCAHDREPGCEVRQALADGRLTQARWDSFLKLERELETLGHRLDTRAAAEERKRGRPGSRTPLESGDDDLT